MFGQISSVREPIGCQMKNAAMSPLHSAAGRSCVSRFFTGTLFGSTPFFVRYSEMNHEPVEPTRVAIGLADEVLRLA